MKEILKKSNYKAILHSKRANIYYLNFPTLISSRNADNY